MERPYFTVVMPSYKVERYLEKAVECVRGQTCTDWELLIVEDCSPDRTGKIAEQLAAADSRIRVIRHKRNKGASEARNTGIREAAGQYIWFMDPDDTAESDLLERVKASFEEHPAKLAVFGHVEEYFDKNGNLSYSHIITLEKNHFTDKEKLHEYVMHMERETVYGYPWNKVYSLDYIREKELSFETMSLNEDIVFNIEYCMDIDSLNTLDYAPYHYAKRMEGSLTTKFVPDYYELHRRRIAMLYDQQKYWGRDTEEVRSILGSLYGRYILSALERNCDKRAKMGRRERKAFCKEVFGDPLFRRLIPPAAARDSRMLALALQCMKRRSVFLCTSFGRAVHIVRTYFPMVYSKVKSER